MMYRNKMGVTAVLLGLLNTSIAFACSDGRFHGNYDPILNRPIPMPEGTSLSTPRIIELIDREFTYEVKIEAEYEFEELAIKIAPGPGVVPNESSFGVFEELQHLTVSAKAAANVMTMTSVQVVGIYQGQEFNEFRFVTARPSKR